MAEFDMYDLLPSNPGTYTPDYTGETLSLSPQKIMYEATGDFGQIKHWYSDKTYDVVSKTTKAFFIVTLPFDNMTASDIGTIWSLYNDSNKAHGMANSFEFVHPTDGHSYISKFYEPLERAITDFMQGLPSKAKLAILHRIDES